MPKYAARTDDNHAEIAAAFRELGFNVFDTSRVGGGFPDLLVYRRINGTLLVEVKDGNKAPSRTRLTPAETAFARDFPVVVVYRVSDVVALANASVFDIPRKDIP